MYLSAAGTYRRKLLLFLLCLFLCSNMPLVGRQRWIAVTTSHFEMYTDESEKRAIDALQTFEQVRYFFLKGSTDPQMLDDRVRIIAFSSEKEYRPYRFNAGAFAYYQQSHERDYVVMQDIEPDHRQVAMHEYTHLVVRHLKLELPIWLNEGLADLFSSLEPEGKKAMVGRPLPGHSQLLSERPWMDWNVLFAVDHDSPYYNVPDKMQLFYAQSWVLTHMLRFSPAYSSGFPKFLTAVANGSSTPDAFQKIYGKTVDQVAKDIQQYVRQTSVKAAIYDVTLSKTDLDPQVADLSPFALDLSQLLSANQKTAAEARSRLLTLEQQNPKNAEVELSLGYLAWQEGKNQEAAQHFKVAVDGGAKDSTVLLQYAQLLQSTASVPQTIEQVLQQSLSLQPDNIEARLFLASTAANARHMAVALGALSPVKKVDAEHAYDFFRLYAFVRAQEHDYTNAKNDANKALTYAKTPNQRRDIENLLGYIESAAASRVESAPAASPAPEPAPQPNAPESKPKTEHVNLERVQGVTKSFDCLGGGTYRLHIQSGGRDMTFNVPHDPRDILVRNAPDAMTMFTCGSLKPQNVTVFYKPDGVIAELDY